MTNKILKGKNNRVYMRVEDTIDSSDLYATCRACAIHKLKKLEHKNQLNCSVIIRHLFGESISCAGVIFKDVTGGI